MRLKYLAAALMAVPGLALFALLGARGINSESGILKFSAVLALMATAIVVMAILQEPSATQREEQKH